MTSPSLTTTIDSQEPIDALPYLSLWIRGGLIGVAAFLTVIFSIALYLDPYERDEAGNIVAAKRQATHRGLGLPACTFYEQTGYPCPSCGMTTSFALLVRGDVWHSLQANFAGTTLATICLLAIPWSLASIWKQRLLFVPSFEMAFTIFIASFMLIMMVRWAIVLGLKFFFGIVVTM
jgi:hypothetical protein